MDEVNLEQWRTVRDAVDANALGHLVGDPDPVVELQLQLALNDANDAVGIMGMLHAHSVRHSQWRDDAQWRDAHEAAYSHDASMADDLYEELELVLDEASQAHDGGASAAERCLMIADRLGDNDSVLSRTLQRSARALYRDRLYDGLRVLVRRLLVLAEEFDAMLIPYKLHSRVNGLELDGRAWEYLKMLYDLARTEAQEAEVRDRLEARALSAIVDGDADALYAAAMYQSRVTGGPFAPQLQRSIDDRFAAIAADDRLYEEAIDHWSIVD